MVGDVLTRRPAWAKWAKSWLEVKYLTAKFLSYGSTSQSKNGNEETHPKSTCVTSKHNLLVYISIMVSLGSPKKEVSFECRIWKFVERHIPPWESDFVIHSTYVFTQYFWLPRITSVDCPHSLSTCDFNGLPQESWWMAKKIESNHEFEIVDKNTPLQKWGIDVL